MQLEAVLHVRMAMVMLRSRIRYLMLYDVVEMDIGWGSNRVVLLNMPITTTWMCNGKGCRGLNKFKI